MTKWIALTLAVGLGLIALTMRGQDDPRPASPRPAGEAAPADGGTGRALLDRVAAAYRAAPGITDTAIMKIQMPEQPPQNMRVEMALGAGMNARLAMPGFSATGLGDRVYVTRDDVPDKYLDVAMSGTLGATLNTLFQGNALVPPQLPLRAGLVEDGLEALGMTILKGVRIAGHEEATDPGGKPVHRLLLDAPNGRGEVTIDAGTKLITGLTIDAAIPNAPPEIRLTADISFDPQIPVRAVELVSFEPKGRKAVADLRLLVPTPIAKGATAPDFTLETLDGKTVSLSDLRGSVVVLDFWATWCGPCRRGLPLLQSFADWANSMKRPVAVYGVDTFERQRTPEERKSAAGAYWTSQKFTMPTLLDLDSSVAATYGIRSIPYTLVIDADGVIASVHSGFDPRMDQTLRREVEELLQK